MKKYKILHCLTAIDDGLSSHICAQTVKALSDKLDHTIVTASGGGNEWRSQMRAYYPADFPQINGVPTPGRLIKLAQAIAPYDLVLTYDYGTLNLAMAHTAFSQAFGLPPLIHHEFGFGEGGGRELTGRRNWYRRIALGRAIGLVIPSERLEGIALTTWHQPIGRVKHIPPCVSIENKPRKVRADALRGLIKRDGELWIGTLDGSADQAESRQVLGALAELPENWHLVIAGEGAHLAAIRQQAERLELSHRLHFPGAIKEPKTLLGLLDIYLAVGRGEAFPLNSLRAMAIGLPIAGIDSEDLSSIVSEANAPFLAQRGKIDVLADRLIALAEDMLARARAGEQNRARVRDHFDQCTMFDRFRRIYAGALGAEL